MFARVLSFFEALGGRVNGMVARLGLASRFFWIMLRLSGTSFRRLPLTIREIYFAGVLSLIIIAVSALFVGMVLGLQGYDTLVRYGSADAVGTLVALSLTRELGPVVAGLLFASRAGSAITAEIGLMKATEQLSAMEMMAVDPIARVVGPRFWGGVISMPLLAALFSAIGIFGGYLVTVQLIGVDEGAFWSQMQSSVDLARGRRQRHHQERRVRRRGDLDRGVRGLRCRAHRRGGVARDHAHRGDLVARDPRARLRADGVHVQRGLDR